MKKIYAGMAIVSVVVSVVIWLVTNFVSVKTLESHIQNEKQSYYPKIEGIRLEQRVGALEAAISELNPKIEAQNKLLVDLLVNQKVIQRDIQELNK